MATIKSIEEKAKHYDEALERAKNHYSTTDSSADIKLIGLIFPELKESEGEKIRKSLSVYFAKFKPNDMWNADFSFGDIVAWLEKQGEKKSIDDLTQQEAMDIAVVKCFEQGEQKPVFEMKTPEESLGIDSNTYNKIVDECVYGEQKPDKVKPKFCAGDWVVYCNDDVDLITGIEENGYSINNGGYIPFICENEMRLWDITDAKVGDVLVSESTCGLGTWYCIFKSLDSDESMTVYCYLARDGRFETKKELCFDKEPYNTKPATKEQRDTLMKAMADAGYTFDFEKKELKKIEQKPNPYSGTSFEYNGHTWGMCARDNGVEILIDGHIKGRVFSNDSNAKEMFIKALERVEEQNSKGYKLTDCDKNSWWEDFKAYTSCTIEQKPAWSEEDEKMLGKCIDAASGYYSPEDKQSMKDWLKSLKERYTWKPSRREKEALLWCVVHLGGADKQTLGELLEALNKL